MTYTLRRKTSVKLGNMRWDLNAAEHLAKPAEAPVTSNVVQGYEEQVRKLVEKLNTPRLEPGYTGSQEGRQDTDAIIVRLATGLPKGESLIERIIDAQVDFNRIAKKI